jgi:sphinganine-1-phosphate aldolase
MLQIFNLNLTERKYYYALFGIMIFKNRGYIDYSIKSLHNWIFYTNKIRATKSFLFNLMMNIPYYRNQLDSEIFKIDEGLQSKMKSLEEGIPRITSMPKIGLTLDLINKNMTTMREIDEKHGDLSKVSGTLYNTPLNEEIELQKMVMDHYYKTNPLHADIFPSLVTMEKDIISITKKLLHCPDYEGVGTVTTGGTESIILALFGYREYGRSKGITNPEIIAPKTVHPAFDKGCYYLGIKINKISVDDNNNIDLNSLKWHINHNTILIVGSAPSFPHGLIDNINLLSEMALKYNIPLHVDACLGGFVLSFLDRGSEFDFSIKGVTSISIDTHKYGCCPKGSSVLVFRERSIFEHCYFIQSEWCGGIYATTNLTGSRSGLTLAWTWSMLNYQGYDKLQKQAISIKNNVKLIKDAFENDTDIYVFGDPDVCVVGFGSNTINIYEISQKLKELGWNLNELQNPPSFHLCVTNCHTTKIIKSFIENLLDSLHFVVNKNKNNKISNNGHSKKSNSGGSIYGTTQKVPDQGIVDNVVVKYLNSIH